MPDGAEFGFVVDVETLSFAAVTGTSASSSEEADLIEQKASGEHLPIWPPLHVCGGTQRVVESPGAPTAGQ